MNRQPIGVSRDFLEKLVDAAVEGIVATDENGSVVVYNQGAQRLFGYAPDEAIGVLQLADLLPEGGADSLLSMLRSPDYGGVGRVDPMRGEVIARGGALVPVNMSAYILEEDGVFVGTASVYTDLRDRIRIERRLATAKEELEISEKRALVAQLAGATAHELNQPLTSVLAYAELVLRQPELSEPVQRAATTILSEVERMAEIVRKIGRITKFETKEYVGSASIIDLDKSTFDP